MADAGLAADSPLARAHGAPAMTVPQLAPPSRLGSPQRRLSGVAVTREVLRIEQAAVSKAETPAKIRLAAEIGDASQAAVGDVDEHDIWHPASSSSGDEELVVFDN